VIDLEEALPAVTLSLRVEANIYFFSAKSLMLVYNLSTRYLYTLSHSNAFVESHKIVESNLPFNKIRQLFSAHHVNGDIYVFYGENDNCEFKTMAAYNIGTPRVCRATYLLNLCCTASKQWDIREITSEVMPVERSGFATTQVGDDIYMFGGYRNGYVHDLWRLDGRA